MTEPAASEQLLRPDPFVEFAGSRVVEADAHRAVAHQRPAPELDNHAGVRHAGALFAVGYAASRALVGASLAPYGESAGARMTESEIAYEKFAVGPVTATAQPGADDWDAALAQIADGQAAQLRTSVTVRSEENTKVAAMAICWQVTPIGEGRDQ